MPRTSPAPRDIWKDGGVKNTVWTASGNMAKIDVEVPEEFGLTLADAVGRVVVVHDAAGEKAVCGIVQYEKPSGDAWVGDTCIKDSSGYEYVLSLEDPDAVLVRDQPTQSWVGDGNSGVGDRVESDFRRPTPSTRRDPRKSDGSMT